MPASTSRLVATVLVAGSLLAGCGADDPSSAPTGGAGAGEGIEVGLTLRPDGTWPIAPETLQFADEDSAVVTTCGGQVCRWDADGGQGEAEGVGGEALSVADGVALDPNGVQVLVADVAAGVVTAVFDEHRPSGASDTLPPIRSVVLGAGGELAASSGEDGSTWLWRVEDGSVVHRLDLPDGYSSGLVFSPDAERIVLVQSLGILEDATGTKLPVVFATGTGQVVGEPEGLVEAVAWAPDGSYLAGVDDTGELAVWDPGDWSRVAGSGVFGAGPVAIGPDSTTVAVADSDDPTTIRLWTPADGTTRVVRTDHRDRVVALAWSQDGERLASASTELTEPAPTPDDPRDEVQVRDIDRPQRVVRLQLPSG